MSSITICIPEGFECKKGRVDWERGTCPSGRQGRVMICKDNTPILKYRPRRTGVISGDTSGWYWAYLLRNSTKYSWYNENVTTIGTNHLFIVRTQWSGGGRVFGKGRFYRYRSGIVGKF